MGEKLKDMSVKWKVGSLLILMLVLAGMNAGGVYMFVQAQEQDGKVINIAGKQRMLSQKMSKEASMLAMGEGEHGDELLATAEEFDGSLAALIEGSEERGIPPAPEEVKPQLLEVREIWESFHSNVKILAGSPRGSEEFQAALEYVHGNNMELLAEMDEAVGLYEQVFSQKISTLKTFLALILLADLIIVALGWFAIQRGIINPLSSIRDMARSIAQGDFKQKIPKPKSRDEVGELTLSLREMVGSIIGGMEDEKQRAESVVKGVGAAVYVTDEKLRVTEFNPQAEKLLGYSREEMLGKPCYEFTEYVGITPACHTEKCSSVKVIDGREEFITRRNLSIRNREGEEIPVDIYTAPLYNAKGERAGAIKTAIDMREAKQREEELNSMKEYLESEIANLTPAIQATARGDLTKKVEPLNPSTEIGKAISAFSDMQGSLRTLVQKLKEASSHVASTAEELSASSEEMNSTTEQVSGSVQEIAKSSQESASQVDRGQREIRKLSDNITRVAESAGSASELAKSTESSAKEGGKHAETASEKMRAIREVSQESSTRVKSLGERSREISNIVEVISNIAEQTNLLALNAAIEAARAGEHGKGFAVVAEEVRKLAEESSSSAEQIDKMIKEIQGEIDEAVEGMEQGSREVNEGSEIVARALEALQGVAESVSETTSKMLEITEAAQEQKSSSDEILSVMEQVATSAEESASSTEEVSASTEEQTASMEELSSSAQELATLADELNSIVDSFSIGESEREEARREQGEQAFKALGGDGNE